VVPFLEGLAAIEDKMVMVLNLVALTGGALNGESAIDRAQLAAAA
jgi:purine-binding chemotaxis protein CheW